MPEKNIREKWVLQAAFPPASLFWSQMCSCLCTHGGSGLSMRVLAQAFLSSLPVMILMFGCIPFQSQSLCWEQVCLVPWSCLPCIWQWAIPIRLTDWFLWPPCWQLPTSGHLSIRPLFPSAVNDTSIWTCHADTLVVFFGKKHQI